MLARTHGQTDGQIDTDRHWKLVNRRFVVVGGLVIAFVTKDNEMLEGKKERYQK
jgi:hypothetical protein